MAYKDPFKLKKLTNKDTVKSKKRKKKPSKKYSWPSKDNSPAFQEWDDEKGIWVKGFAPPKKVWAPLDPRGLDTADIRKVKPTNPGLRGRKKAYAEGSRPVRPRPMKGVPRNIPPEIDPKYKRKPVTKKPAAKKRSITKMSRKKGGQKLKDLGKRKPKIKVDLTPHYRPKPPPRGKPTKGPAISSPTRPPTKNIIGPSLWGSPDREGRLKSRKPKPVKGGSSPPKSKPPAWIKRGVWPGFQSKRTKVGVRTGASGLSKLVKAMNK